jgi:hypothetical protein
MFIYLFNIYLQNHKFTYEEMSSVQRLQKGSLRQNTDKAPMLHNKLVQKL